VLVEVELDVLVLVVVELEVLVVVVVMHVSHIIGHSSRALSRRSVLA